ncbi:nucleotidyl transferase AbiEii/AbiGii toxin family protein [Candidatus Micrarchaeota archaeon]|nr:nucleotidyl transferase AbiEii/AbiGii toxin family protein [Candidatus Micrarchaeota archaeon]
MINKEEIVSLARAYGIKPWQEEKKYVHALLLNELADYPVVFKGGTYLWLLHGLRRFSEDLDFTAAESLPSGLPEKVSRALAGFGVNNKVSIEANNQFTLSFRVGATGPLHTSDVNKCFVYVEISKREKVLLKPTATKLEFPRFETPTKVIRGMDLSEVAAEKVRAILTRDKARDLYDLYFLATAKGISFDETLVNEKLKHYGLKFSGDSFSKSVDKKKNRFVGELKQLVFGELPPFKECAEVINQWASTKTD